MPAAVAVFRVEALADDEIVIVRLPAAERRDPGFARRLAAFVERDAAPGARLRRRDSLIRQLAAEHYAGTDRARATALLADARAYEAVAWKVDVRSASCPERLRGTARELLWHAFKSARRFPTSVRQLQNILRVK